MLTTKELESYYNSFVIEYGLFSLLRLYGLMVLLLPEELESYVLPLCSRYYLIHDK
jgi:hypothetical protein